MNNLKTAIQFDTFNWYWVHWKLDFSACFPSQFDCTIVIARIVEGWQINLTFIGDINIIASAIWTVNQFDIDIPNR